MKIERVLSHYLYMNVRVVAFTFFNEKYCKENVLLARSFLFLARTVILYFVMLFEIIYARSCIVNVRYI
ncbi:hypothetical protein Syun_028943 [Stephania yunnanensis]|uniref:Uncharacterized protein n=1 Tax=Stephania yunnanensis TaxID=152371 RepID=A0AAP0HGW6_9MAGN